VPTPISTLGLALRLVSHSLVGDLTTWLFHPLSLLWVVFAIWGVHEFLLKQATTLVVTYPVVNAVSENGNAAAVAWERAFINLVKV
jgi:uncharacterized protein (DUF2062 family)